MTLDTIYKTMFNNAGEAMLLIEGDHFELANPAAAEILGYQSPDELTNVLPWQISPTTQPNGQSSEECGQEHLNVVQREGRHRFEWDHLTKTGEVMPVDVTLTRIESGGRSFVLSCWRDIQKQRAVQRAMKIAEDRAEIVAQLKGEIVTNVNHEFRTPLNGLLGLLDVACMAPETPDLIDMLKIAQQSGRDLLSILDQLLDFDRLQTGAEQPLPRLVDESMLLGDTLEGLECHAKAKALAFDFASAINPEQRFLTDDRHFRKLLYALGENAIKFTAEGSITISLAWEPSVGAAGQLRLSVEDTGVGIASTDHETIFQRFFQADGSLSRLHQGTGIGLALCRELVALHGGSISVSSVVGKGSRFVAEWPVAAPSRREGARS